VKIFFGIGTLQMADSQVAQVAKADNNQTRIEVGIADNAEGGCDGQLVKIHKSQPDDTT
jgi:hypothetical protein